MCCTLASDCTLSVKHRGLTLACPKAAKTLDTLTALLIYRTGGASTAVGPSDIMRRVRRFAETLRYGRERPSADRAALRWAHRFVAFPLRLARNRGQRRRVTGTGAGANNDRAGNWERHVLGVPSSRSGERRSRARGLAARDSSGGTRHKRQGRARGGPRRPCGDPAVRSRGFRVPTGRPNAERSSRDPHERRRASPGHNQRFRSSCYGIRFGTLERDRLRDSAHTPAVPKRDCSCGETADAAVVRRVDRSGHRPPSDPRRAHSTAPRRCRCGAARGEHGHPFGVRWILHNLSGV
jgi:hypothetical protein